MTIRNIVLSSLAFTGTLSLCSCTPFEQVFEDNIERQAIVTHAEYPKVNIFDSSYYSQNYRVITSERKEYSGTKRYSAIQKQSKELRTGQIGYAIIGSKSGVLKDFKAAY